ncbi:ComEB Deoxycytidylate deaminase [uncultured Caudovirales phage]|uniref:ComEB Deoxycytidylate deaminase n=1 Tax=uncultured Caudovirales phage TaxID=2100421 RepID=A0A6J5KUC6_9CAUD|nr:ComEB Deoxycytidylate deaminase [uncultured Caudovirales phage]CAB5208935.1 ComEB Deoxycytidylate deaminase [uncultured Caudovirales phage]
MKPKFKQLYMTIAETVATMSHARRLQVGSIVVKDDRVISIGYNGMPAGWNNDCEYKVYATEWSIDNNIWDFQEEDGTAYNLKTRPEVLHAESNAISKLAKSSESGDGATIFITHAPCVDCAKLIYQSGINSVFYRNAYRSDDGVKFLKQSGVTVEQIERNN